MKRLLVIGAIVAVAALVAVAIAIAATGSSGSGTNSSGANTSGATVSVQKLDGSRVLVDSAGKALYRSDQERNGMVLCTGSCLSFWQPLTVKGTPKAGSLKGKLGVVKRPDGARQVTFSGKLLYSFKLDSPGQLQGDNFKDAFAGQKFHWLVVRPVGSSSSTPAKSTPTPTYSGPNY